MNLIINYLPFWGSIVLIAVCSTFVYALSKGWNPRFLQGESTGSTLDWNRVDAVNAGSKPYQFAAILSQIILVSSVWLLIWSIRVSIDLAICGPDHYKEFVRWEATPKTHFWWFAFLVFYQQLVWGYNRENTVRGSVNVFRPLENNGADDGTKVRATRAGIFFRKFGDTPGKVTDIDRERNQSSEEFTITVWQISLEAKIEYVWLPWIYKISRWFQNGKTEKEREGILRHVTLAAQQAAEEFADNIIASSRSRDKVLQALHVLSNQTQLQQQAVKAARKEGKRYGVYVKALRFAKLDLPQEVQAKLNALLESNAQVEIAKKLKNIGEGPALIAAAMAGVKGITIDKKLYGLSTDEALLELINLGKANPAALVALAKAWGVKKKS